MNADIVQFWAIVAILAIMVLAIMMWPLFKRRNGANAPREEYDINVYKDQLLEIEADLERGLLSEDQGEAARTEIKRRMLAAADSGEVVATGPSGLSRMIIVVLSLCLPLGAVLMYISLGNPDQPDQPLAGRDLPATSTAAVQHAGQGDMSQAAAKLAKYLESNPDDLRGWVLLGRTYMTRDSFSQAVSAYKRAYELSDGDAAIGADYGEAAVMADNSTISDGAYDLFETVLAADASNPKARYYMGMYKAQQGDVPGALQAWLDLIAISAPDAPWLPTIQQQIDLAAKETGIDPATLRPSPGIIELAKKIQQTAARTAEQDDARKKQRSSAPQPTTEDVRAAMGMTETDRNEMIRTMVEQLAGRMKENPDDKSGWVRLERAYRVLGETEKADHAASQAAKLP